MPRLLLTGGSGYLGSELRRRAVAWEVAAPSSAELDIRDAVAFDADAVIHTAYRQTGPEARSIIVDGSAAVARAATASGARLIHLSSDLVFDGTAAGAYTEEDPPSPVVPYGEAKAEAERAVLKASPGALVVRTSLLYGGPEPGRHELMARDPAAAFFTDEIRCPTHVGDLAEALLAHAADDLTGVLHLAGADAVSRWELARLLAGHEVRAATSAGSGRPLNCALRSVRVPPLRGVREVLGRRD